MFTVEEIEGWLERISYKPNVKFSVFESRYTWGRDLTVICTFRVPNAVSPEHEPIDVVSRLVLPLHKGFDFKEFIHFLGHSLRSHELHEFEEFFRVDGKLVNDPHELEKVK